MIFRMIKIAINRTHRHNDNPVELKQCLIRTSGIGRVFSFFILPPSSFIL